MASLILSATTALSAQVFFYGIGDLPGGGFRSEVRDAVLTPNGIVAVGTGSRFGTQGDTPIKWTPSGGIVELANDFPTNNFQSFVAARVISASGSVFGGSARGALTGNNRGPAFWTSDGNTLARLGFLGGSVNFFPNVGVNSLSADGSVAFGFNRAINDTTAAFRYTPAGGMLAIGYLRPTDNVNFPSAHSTSSDGTVVIGNSGFNAAGPGIAVQAYRYVYNGTGATGGAMTELPTLPGGTWTSAFAMTPDGTTMIGLANSPSAPVGELVRWKTDGSMVSLGAPEGVTGWSNFGGVSADGETIAIATNNGTYLRNPSGWFHIQTLLTEAGIDLTGWTIGTALGMSADGRLVYGVGTHNGNAEGYVIQLPVDFLRVLGDTTPPVLTLPADLVVEATGPNGAVANFAATANDAVDGDVPVIYSQEPGSIFPLGATTVTVSTTDGSDNVASGSFTVTVRDTTAPAISAASTNAPSLWPANHKMVAVTVSATASDAVGPVSYRIVSATSNEPDNGLGDGDTANDIQITGAMKLNLRAERSGKGNGRVYTITVEATDGAGNTSTGTVTVLVPKNQSGK